MPIEPNEKPYIGVRNRQHLIARREGDVVCMYNTRTTCKMN